MKKILIDLRQATAECDYAILIKQIALLNKDTHSFTVMGEEKTLLTLKGFDNVEFLTSSSLDEVERDYDGTFYLLADGEKAIDREIGDNSFFFSLLKKRQCLMIEIPNNKEISKDSLLALEERAKELSSHLFEKEEVVGKILLNEKVCQEGFIDYSEFRNDESDYLLYKKEEWDLFSKGLKEGSVLLYDYLFNKGSMNFRNAMGKFMFRNSYSFFVDSDETNLLDKTRYLYEEGKIYVYYEGKPTETSFKNTIKTLLLLTK